MRLIRRGLGTGLLWSRILPAGLVLLAAGTALLSVGSHPRATSAGAAAPLAAFGSRSLPSHFSLPSLGRLPMMFEPNQGTTDSRVRFIARGAGYGLFLTDQEAVLSLPSTRLAGKHAAREVSVVRMKLAGGTEHPQVAGLDELPGRSNYFIGSDPAKWRRDVAQYARVRYSQIYPGVDLVYYGNQGRLEYDFQIAPGTDPKSIQLSFAGVHSMELESGDLVLATPGGDVRVEAPRVYQRYGTTGKAVEGRFVLLANNHVGFEVGNYDRNRTLIIDPVLNYSSYLGGTGAESLPYVAVDSAPSIYLSGTTSSTDFPVTDKSILQPGATTNVFVAKLDPTGATLIFATYLGGTGADTSVGVAVDAAQNVYVAGTTTSTNFPTTASTAFQATPLSPGNPHAFVSQLSATGGLSYSTYLSGSKTDTAQGMTLDNKGFVYVIGITDSTDFPLAPAAGTFQSTLLGSNAFFISKVAPTSSGANSLAFSTYFGGGNPANGTVAGGAIAVDNDAAGSNIYFTGGTNFLFTGNNATTDFPIRNAINPGGACLDAPTQPSTTPCTTSGLQNMDAFVAKLNPGTTTGAQLLYCTYVGGTGTDIGRGIGLDASGNAYITGSTDSTAFPTSSVKGRQMSPGGGTDAFVAKINNPATGTGTTNVQLTYFSFLGGSKDDVGNGIVVDSVQGARVVGTTASADFPVIAANAIQTTLKGTQDAFVARLDTPGTTPNSEFITYLGGSESDRGIGIAIDTDANTYVSGDTTSSDFPTANHPFQPALNGPANGPPDAFVAKLGPSLNFNITANAPTSNSVNAGNQLSYTYQITNTGDTTDNVAFTDNLSGGSGSAPVTFVSASAAGGSCPTTPTDNKILCNLGTINGSSMTTVTVNLTPTGPGTIANSGTVSVGAFSKTAIATPVAVNSFKIAALRSSNTVVAGNPASYPIEITPLSVYTASISISCNAGLPGGGTTCTPSTTPITLQGSSPSTVTLVISTFPRVSTTAGLRPGRGLLFAGWLPLTGLAVVGLSLGGGLNRRRLLGSLLFLALATLILLQPACGGHSSTTTTTGTPAGTYTITVSATSGSFSQSTPITLVVQ